MTVSTQRGVPSAPDRRTGGRFERLLAAVGVSNLGDGVAATALPLLAAALTRDPALVAGLTVVQQLPWLLFALPAGVVVDRSDPAGDPTGRLTGSVITYYAYDAYGDQLMNRLVPHFGVSGRLSGLAEA